MTERPFFQLYVSDFVGDTMHLSAEQVGSYLLILMAMWNAGGALPDSDSKLATISRMSVKKWRAVADDILAFFERADGLITNPRLSKELQKVEGKSQKRSAAGARGAEAKRLKNNDAASANASGLPEHSPEARYQNNDKLPAQKSEAARAPDRYDGLLDKLLEANGIREFRAERHVGLMNLGPIIALLDAGLDLDLDVLAAIRGKPNPAARGWSYFEGQTREHAQRRRSAASLLGSMGPVKSTDWRSWLTAYRDSKLWNPPLGPKPDEAGCRAPPELLGEFGFVKREAAA